MRRLLPRLLMTAAMFCTAGISICERHVVAADAFPDPVPKVKAYEITFNPAKEPSPAFRYRLVTDIENRNAGNAASYYLRALLLLKQLPAKTLEQNEREAALLEMPQKDLPLDELKSIVERNKSVISEIEFATSCEHCDWGIRFEDLRGPRVIELLIPEFQSIRDLARILRARSRLEIAEKKYDEAIATLRQMFQMSRNLSRIPNIICTLIAVAIHQVANEGVMELISSEGSPNLYWALQSLPNPLVDFQPAVELESTMALRLFPFLKDAETEQHSPDEWYRLLANVITSLNEVDSQNDPNLAPKTLMVPAMLLKAYPIAKRDLIASGFDAKKLEEMSTGQVIAIYARDCYLQFGSEYRKWMSVPFAQGHERLRKSNERLISEGYMSTTPNIPSDRDPLLINTRLGYSAENVLAAENRQAFMAAALIAIEAIRMHAAANGGKLPTSLDQITVVPVPNDPSTGRPFHYRVADGKAELLVLPTDPNNTFSGRHFILKVK